MAQATKLRREVEALLEPLMPGIAAAYAELFSVIGEVKATALRLEQMDPTGPLDPRIAIKWREVLIMRLAGHDPLGDRFSVAKATIEEKLRTLIR